MEDLSSCSQWRTQEFCLGGRGGAVAYPGIFFGGGSTNSVEDREDGDLGAVAP